MPDIPDSNWSERDDRNAEVAPFGWPPGVPAQIELIGRMMMGAVKRFWNKINPAYATGGTADNYVVVTEGQTAFINMYEVVRVRVDRANTTTTPTLKVGQTNARTIVKIGSAGIVPLVIGDMLAGKDHSFWYNGTNYVLADPATVDAAQTVGVLKTANNLSELTATAATARTNIGLGNVDNTSDVNKPVSTAQAAAIAAGDGATLASAQSYADAGLALKLSLSGGTMSGGVNFNSQAISNPSGVLLKGTIYGLTLSNNAGDLTNDIDIAAGVAASDETTPFLMILAAALTGKRLDANWAAGSGNGMRYSGAAIANTTYHLYLASNALGATVDLYADPSAVPATVIGHLQAETGGASYTRVRRVGSILRESASIVAFQQYGNRFVRNTPSVDDTATTAFASQTITLAVPAGILLRPIVQSQIIINASGNVAYQVGDAAIGSAVFPVQSLLASGTGAAADRTTIDFAVTNTNRQIYHSLSIAAGSISQRQLQTVGWYDDLL